MNEKLNKTSSKEDLQGWVSLYYKELIKWAMHKTSDYALAEGLVQDTFLAAWKDLEKFESKSQPKTKQESWEILLKEAKEENKLIFVDLYATWCGPCKMMKVHTFTKKEVGEFYNEHFINVSLNGEINKGAELMEKYNLRSFPSLLFINGDDKIVVHTKGYHNAKQILELGNQVNLIQKSELQRP
jgi:thiol:disulfide interchange protein